MTTEPNLHSESCRPETRRTRSTGQTHPARHHLRPPYSPTAFEVAVQPPPSKWNKLFRQLTKTSSSLLTSIVFYSVYGSQILIKKFTRHVEEQIDDKSNRWFQCQSQWWRRPATCRWNTLNPAFAQRSRQQKKTKWEQHRAGNGEREGCEKCVLRPRKITHDACSFIQ